MSPDKQKRIYCVVKGQGHELQYSADVGLCTQLSAGFF